MPYLIDLESFERFLEGQNLAPGTIQNYLYELRKIPHDDQESYLNLNRKKRMLIVAWRKYLKFLKVSSQITAEEYYNQLDYHNPPKRRGKTSKGTWYNREEWQKIIEKVPTRIGKMAAYMQLNFGFRVGEVVKLRIKEDIDLENNYLHVQERPGWVPKHGRNRSIPITKSQRRVIKRWIENRPANINHDYFLYNQKGGELIIRTLQRWYAQAGIKSHDLRRSFAKVIYYNSGKDVKLVSDLLGHANVAITSQYLGLESSEIREKFNKAMS